ncbi:hypothetical protein HU200_008102 [Digitaria exilis]|uniref:Uncharacterized protein n=1 Tax=Digitaria exilis TaxID=1010633 RepID=A0A835FLS9_9POAL|nr:hypothetical protein HU200_008102 [Digitaria exilis]
MSSGPDGLRNAMAESHHHDDHGGNYGPVIGILILIAILTGGALAVARYLVGPRAFQRTGYDFDAFVQRKFAVCLGSGGAGNPAAPPVKRTCDLRPDEAAADEEVGVVDEEMGAAAAEEEVGAVDEEVGDAEEVGASELPVEEVEEEEEEEESVVDP